MNRPLLSIVIPTKNRIKYLFSFMEICKRFNDADFELVIQDNSEDNSELLNYIHTNNCQFLRYFYNPENMSMSENSDLAIKHASGEYVCFMGDDDLLSEKLIDFVRQMKSQGVDSAVFNSAGYSWPGVTFKIHQFPNLMIPKFSGKVTYISVKNEYRKLMRRGATRLGKIPQLYHGVVRRTVLDNMLKITGTYFPGPSPDMAVAIALIPFVEKLVYVDAPLVSSGACPKSSAGLGAKHMHKGDIKEISFLPPSLEKTWDCTIPMIWTGPTIYAVTALESLRSTRRNQDISLFNYPYFYAFFDLYNPEYKSLSKAGRKKTGVNCVLYTGYYFRLFFERCLNFFKNIIIVKFKYGVHLYDGINDTLEAEKIIDEELNNVSIKF